MTANLISDIKIKWDSFDIMLLAMSLSNDQQISSSSIQNILLNDNMDCE
jgi:hypothetical protein